MTRPLLVQTHWSDFDSFAALIEDPQVGLVARARREFDDVVLVCGDDPRNERVHEFARAAGVSCFAGDDADVGLRFAACMAHFGFTRAARALAHHFAVDFGCVEESFGLLESDGTQCVVLPCDFDLRFGCDVFTASFLDEARAVAIEADGTHRRRLRHTPWGAADLAPERFELSHQGRVPEWDRERLDEIRTIVNALYPERSRKEAMPLPGYEHAVELLPAETRRVLDVACGWGDGTAFLARGFQSVTGADHDLDQIRRNTEAHPTASFTAGDATDPSLFDEASFDAIVSIHSMEHFQDDARFLDGCRRWLRPGGRFVLEVPLVMETPFRDIDVPIGDGHVREYRVESLLDLVGEHFDVRRSFGVARGLYLPLERARNAVMLELLRC